MRYTQIVGPTRSAQPSKTHPYIATVALDPFHWTQFQQRSEDNPATVITNVDRSTPDLWTVTVACASEMVRDMLEQADW